MAELRRGPTWHDVAQWPKPLGPHPSLQVYLREGTVAFPG